METMEHLNNLIIEESAIIKERTIWLKNKYAEQFNITFLHTDCMLPPIMVEGLVSNIKNLLAIFGSNLAEGLLYFYKSIRLEADLKQERNLKQRALLFIIQNNLLNEFQEFNNNYKNDDPQNDIYMKAKELNIS